MNKFVKTSLCALGIATVATGCMTANSLATADNVGAKWEKFISLESIPYESMGYPTIDGIGQEVTIQTDLYINDVVKPMIEADKEGYTGMVAQFEEDVGAAKSDGKTADDVLAAWNERYGAENVKRLGTAFDFVRTQQKGKNAMLAIAVQRLPQYVELSKRMPKAIDEIKAGSSNPFETTKKVGAASQLGDRIDALIWSVKFMQTLSKDQAAETAALQEFVNSFTSKVN